MNLKELQMKLIESIVNLKFDESKNFAQMMVDHNIAPPEIIYAFSEGMRKVGMLYEQREYFVPELLVAARVMNEALQLVEPYLATKMEKSEATSIIVGTVQGDIHDIGKNVLISLLQASGFQVHDLGTDVIGDHFIEKLKETRAPILALSSLLTSSAPEIKAVIGLLKTTGLRNQVKVIIGGAAVTKEFANEVGADGYAIDAIEGVRLCKRLVSEN